MVCADCGNGIHKPGKAALCVCGSLWFDRGGAAALGAVVESTIKSAADAALEGNCCGLDATGPCSNQACEVRWEVRAIIQAMRSTVGKGSKSI